MKPTWSDYLLGLAKVVSQLSPDAQTKHGCVIVGSDHRILSTGCNGFPRRMKDDSKLPTTRPEKYSWMLHSEENAICNANGPLEGGTAYITGRACKHCLMLLWQKGVGTAIQIDGYGWQKDAAEAVERQQFIDGTGMQVIDVTPDLNWLADLVVNDPVLLKLVQSKLEGSQAA